MTLKICRGLSGTESVTVKDGQVTHWAAKPRGCKLVQWDAEIINEHQNRMLAWRSLPGSDVDSAGSVWFEPASAGNATEVKVAFKYVPPAGKLGAALAKIFGKDPAKHVREDLPDLKSLFESGEIRKTGQPPVAPSLP